MLVLIEIQITLVTRMPDLIKSLVTFASRQLGGLLLSTPSASLAGRSASPAERSSHINRILYVSQNKSTMPPPRVTLKRRNKAILKTVFLLDKVCYEHDEDNG